MSPEDSIHAFTHLVARVTGRIAGQPVDATLADLLNREFPAGGEVFRAIQAACAAGVAGGWMCQHAAGGIKYGRVVKPCPELHGFSIDVVEMADVVGPHHRHPQGEIDLIMPLEGTGANGAQGAISEVKFDGHGAGWLVYGPDSAHKPTVSGGRAYVLYLLPQGAIEFTRG